MEARVYIIRAGMTGCLAAIRYPQAIVLESDSEAKVNHHALLRLRSTRIQELTGIKLEKVKAEKFIWVGGDKCTKKISPIDVVEYSRKTNGLVENRSIENMDTEVRYIPPQDFHEQMIHRIRGRIRFNCPVTKFRHGYLENDDGGIWSVGDGVISTLPLEENLSITNNSHNLDFSIMSRPIYVNKFRLRDYNLHMTVYFPRETLSLYRASIVGDIIIIESTLPITTTEKDIVFEVFGIRPHNITKIIASDAKQNNGKIQSVDENLRKTLLYRMTSQSNLYSLGRFACWRNIVLDDVMNDLDKIDTMINTHEYDRNLS